MENIYQHFRKEELEFVAQAMEWKSEVSLYQSPKLTNFLDPREQMILSSIIGKDNEVGLSFLGGTPYVERKRALVFPTYFEVEDDDFQLAIYEIKYPSKFVNISHRDVLGALMSLGVKREKFGDIILSDGCVQLILAKEISSYVELNLNSIGQAKVKVKRIPMDSLMTVQDVWDEKSVTVSSMRLDVILSEIYNMSRSKAVQFIEKNLIKVNWKTIENPSFQVEEGDYLSGRQLGRSKVISVEGSTKKGKIRLIIGIKK